VKTLVVDASVGVKWQLDDAVSPHLDWVRWIGDYVVEGEERDGTPEAKDSPNDAG